METPRIVVTGMGLISPVGNTVAASWENIKQGRSGIGFITAFDTSNTDLKYAGEVKDFDPVAIFGTKEAKRTDRVQQFAIVAAEQALTDSGLTFDEAASYDVGVIIGTGIGGIITMAEQLRGFYEKGQRGVSPVAVPQLLHDGISSRVSMHLGIRGPNYDITTACATGNNCIGDAADMLKLGRVKSVLVGASEACIMPVVLSGFSNMKALARVDYDDPTHASRPFDLNRQGFVAGEGAAMLVLERLEDALARGAKIYAEITGYGHTSDAFHVTAPRDDGAGAAEAMKRALREAGISAEQVDYVNAHGTGTPLNDKSETAALKLAFGEQAYNLAISSTKSMTGHMQGATGAAETIFSIMAIRDNFVPPTINLVTPDPECDLNYTPNVGIAKPVHHVLNYTAGFGGHNVALVIQRYPADN